MVVEARCTSRVIDSDQGESINPKTKYGFLAIVTAQALHSAEEYLARLYDVFSPARFVSGLVSSDLSTGFLVVNSAVVLFGVWCYLFRVMPNRKSAVGWMWFWIVFEGANGIGHVLLAINAGTYFPGLLTAPLLILTTLLLASRILNTSAAQETQSS